MDKKEEKLCPLLKVVCIKDKCAMWYPVYEDVDFKVKNKDGVDYTVMRYTVDCGYCGYCGLKKRQNMNLNDLKKVFETAKRINRNYIGVQIEMQGFPKPEVIINEYSNFDAKLAYYMKAYNDDLTLKTFNGIKIIGFCYGNTYQDIEELLDI